MTDQQGKNREQGVGYGRPPVATRFKPGQSGNPRGRPAGQSLTALLRDALESRTIGGVPIPEGRTVAEALAETLIVRALAGDSRCLREILNRTEGRPAREVRMEEPNPYDALSDDELLAALSRIHVGGDDKARPGSTTITMPPQ